MRVAVVGAGLAGLMAARTLTELGHTVTVFERARSPGGRLATRRIGAARLDHGAQFFTVRSDVFARAVEQWQHEGLVYEWSRGFDSEPDGHPRFAVAGGMNALAKRIGKGLDVRCGSLVFGIHRSSASDASWRVRLDDASLTEHDGVVVTCPLPQAYSLLVTGHVSVPDLLWRTDYHRTLALLAVLDGPGALTGAGGVQRVAPFEFVADNRMKGISDVHALTLHADAAWSLAHWEAGHGDVMDALTDVAGPYLGRARIVERQLKRWRFATPASIWPDPCWSPDDGKGRVVLAGDAFAGPRVEGAALSGVAAAQRLHDL